MNNLKIKLFEFKKALSVEQHEVTMIAESCFNKIDSVSELEAASYLKNNLEAYKYYENVKTFVEEMDMHLSDDKLLYELKDVYSKVDRKNFSALYRQPLLVLLEIINTSDNQHRMTRIINELSQYDWVDEIKGFMWKFNSKPEDRLKYSKNGGINEEIFTVITKVNETDTLSYIKDRWFLISEDTIKNVVLENYITDVEELKSYRLLEEAVKHGSYNDDKIVFQLDETLNIGVSTKNDGKIFINNEEIEGTSTLETIFSSSIVPFLNRNYYPVINETLNNVKKFVKLNIVTKITNILNPYLESYAFNFQNNMYVYRCDKRYSNQLFKYENATTLISDVIKDLDYDLTEFYKDKVEEDVKLLLDLETTENSLKESITELDNVLLEISMEDDTITTSPEFVKLKNNLLVQRHNALEECKKVNAKRINIINKK